MFSGLSFFFRSFDASAHGISSSIIVLISLLRIVSIVQIFDDNIACISSFIW